MSDSDRLPPPGDARGERAPSLGSAANACPRATRAEARKFKACSNNACSSAADNRKFKQQKQKNGKIPAKWENTGYIFRQVTSLRHRKTNKGQAQPWYNTGIGQAEGHRDAPFQQNMACNMDTTYLYCPLARRDRCRVYKKGCFYG